MITSPKNPRVAEALKLRKRGLREERRRFLVEGPQAVGEAMATGPGLEVLFHSGAQPAVGTARELGVPTVEVGEELIRRLTSTVTPQGLVGVAQFVDVPLADLPSNLDLVAVMFAIRDPGNAGAVLRSANAAGADAVVVAGDSVDVYNPKVVRSSAGSIFHLPVVRDAEIGDAVAVLRGRGLTVFAASSTGERDLHSLDLSGPSAFVFGNEAWGLPADVADLADATVRIPLSPRAESINVAAAASVFLFEAVRQRSAAGALAGVISGAAHDIRSPLAALTAAASTLQRRWAGMSDDQRSMLLDAVVSDSARVNESLRHLVDAARIGQGKLELSSSPVDVAEVVQGVANGLRRDPDLPRLDLSVDEATAPADEERLRSAVRSMIRAAAWWGREGPIRVAVRGERGRVVIDVVRAAPDLGPDDASLLFAADRPGPGAGIRLGLFAAHGFAAAQGGSLVAESADDLHLSLTLAAG